MHPYLLKGLALSPIAFEKVLRAIPESRMDERPDPDRFSPREAIAHLADWEPILRARIRLAAESPGSKCEAYDEGLRAIERNYASSDPYEQVGLFRRERGETIALIASLTPAQLALQLVHPERGPESAYDTANMLLGHDLYHLEQLSALLSFS